MDVLIPVAHCRICKQRVPIVMLDYTLDETIEPGLDGVTAQFIYCAICENVLNISDDVEVDWYNAEELPKVTNFKMEHLNGTE